MLLIYGERDRRTVFSSFYISPVRFEFAAAVSDFCSIMQRRPHAMNAVRLVRVLLRVD